MCLLLLYIVIALAYFETEKKKKNLDASTQSPPTHEYYTSKPRASFCWLLVRPAAEPIGYVHCGNLSACMCNSVCYEYDYKRNEFNCY